ncbi:MAG TPA: triose-phosphate isomerase [Acidobacteriaceae bacterium]
MRKKLIAANWKMYKTSEEVTAFATAFLPLVASNKRDEIVLAPPTIWLTQLHAALKGSNVSASAQTMDFHKEGAFTGETSPLMLKNIGVDYVIIGHSERRQYFNETDETVNLKLKAAIEQGLTPIVCVGELLAERESGKTGDVLKRQVSIALTGVTAADAAKLVIAYEPVWAIGTGKTATPEIAEDAHKLIRAELATALGKDVADATRILYGGSVKPDNCPTLMACANIDGALVGGASLDPASFAKIANYAV